MKNIPIKFRGKDIIGGGYLYGDYVSRDEGCAIRIQHQTDLFDMHEYEIAVDPDSVTQLIGYDVDGTEIYEGDTVDAFCDDNSEAAFSFKAQLANNITLPDPVTNIKYRVRRKADEKHSS